MSRKTTIEFLGLQRRLYQALKDHLKRKLALANFCEATGYSHKYANKLLTGNRMPHEHPGRGKTYTSETLRLLEDMWYQLGCPCPRYLVARIEKNLADYKASVNVPPDCQAQMLAISVATLTRHLRGKKRIKPGSLRKDYRLGLPNKDLAFVAVGSGETVPVWEVPPGDVQVDTVALCGGDMSGDFFWIVTLTDRRTQWTEIRPVWNRGAAAVFAALEDALAAFPFAVTSLHYDNGKEFMNAHLASFAASHPDIRYARSRTGKCNDNAHVEEKNGSVVRELFGEMRYDRYELKGRLEDFCARWSRYVNYCKCSIMITSRTKRYKAKGYVKTYDEPQTPAERVLAFPGLRVKYRDAVERAAKDTNGIVLRGRLLRVFRRIKRAQEALRRAPDGAAGLGASRRPSGDVPRPRQEPVPGNARVSFF